MIAIGCNATEKRFIIWVKDNGIGFDMEYHDKIFGIYHRIQHAEGHSGNKSGKGAIFYMESRDDKYRTDDP
jgi:hypothetical protein